jgi:hypothetical protein
MHGHDFLWSTFDRFSHCLLLNFDWAGDDDGRRIIAFVKGWPTSKHKNDLMPASATNGVIVAGCCVVMSCANKVKYEIQTLP